MWLAAAQNTDSGPARAGQSMLAWLGWLTHYFLMASEAILLEAWEISTKCSEDSNTCGLPEEAAGLPVTSINLDV
jgi:hypothetical protein